MAATTATAAKPSAYHGAATMTAMIRADHEAIRALIDDFKEAQGSLATSFPAAGSAPGQGEAKGGLERILAIGRSLVAEVSAHASCEERLLYPLVKTKLVSAMSPALAGATPLGGGGGGVSGNVNGGGGAAAAAAEPSQPHGDKPTPAQQRDAEALYEKMLADDQCNKEVLQWLDRRVPGEVECAAEGCARPKGSITGGGERGESGHAAAGGCGDVERALVVSMMAKFACVELEHMQTEEALVLAPLEALLTPQEQQDMAAAWRKAKEGAPVHPHPRGPVTAAAATVAHPAAAAVDKAAAAMRAGVQRVVGLLSSATAAVAHAAGRDGGGGGGGDGHAAAAAAAGAEAPMETSK